MIGALGQTPRGPAPLGAGPFSLSKVCARPFLALLTLLAAQPATAQGWTEEKCARYARAWTDAVARIGTGGLSPGFVAAHDAFVASGCCIRSACPRSQAERNMADIMTIAALNAGLSGTFLPFVCRP